MLEPRIAATYDAWRAQPGLPEDLAAELASIQGDKEAITDRFYRELAFGTGGLRGVIGAGTNRMNVYNIRKATQGPGRLPERSGLPKKAAIGYDSRIKSDVFARETACVLAANGITAYLYPRLEPTPRPVLGGAVLWLRRGRLRHRRPRRQGRLPPDHRQ